MTTPKVTTPRAPNPSGPAWLFCPADRPDRFAKAKAVADIVILDLEDGVAAADKAAARQALISTPMDPRTTVVRLNAAGTDAHREDLAALRHTQYQRVMLAKAQSPADLAALTGLEIVLLIESSAGALALTELIQLPSVIGLMWGAEDLIASLGGTTSRQDDGSYHHVVQQVRSSALLAAKAHRKLAVDAVYLNITDLNGLGLEAAEAAQIGFDAKVAIHPSQIQVIRQAYSPRPAQIHWAERVLAAALTERGVFALDGQMVDAPVLRQAEQLLRRRIQE